MARAAERHDNVAGASVALEADDFTPAGLRAAQQAVHQHYGAKYRDLPLDVKAEYFEWELWRYHVSPWDLAHHYVKLPAERGQSPDWLPSSDCSTWNGALLAALSHKYAVTRDARTLERIGRLLRGMHFCFDVTRTPGLVARTVARHDGSRPDQAQPYDAPDGTRYYFRGDPAKGGYNQIAAGLASVLLWAGPDLPADLRMLARRDLTALVLHLVDHDYHITMAGGKRTPHGNLTPVIATVGVPFNAQVAYTIVAAGRCFPPDDPAERARIEAAYRYLRDEHHCYYQDPLKNLLVRPQEIVASPFLKGMNDRNHVMNAAFLGLVLERHQAVVEGRAPFDDRFMYRLGQTMQVGAEYLDGKHNALCSFMWAALLSDPQTSGAIVPKRQEAERARMERMLVHGVEQLRRFPLDRFHYPGRLVPMPTAVWVDRRRVSDYHWKEPHDVAFQATAAPTGEVTCGTDYLYAYWLWRHYGLDRHPQVTRFHGPVVNPRLAGP